MFTECLSRNKNVHSNCYYYITIITISAIIIILILTDLSYSTNYLLKVWSVTTERLCREIITNVLFLTCVPLKGYSNDTYYCYFIVREPVTISITFSKIYI